MAEVRQLQIADLPAAARLGLLFYEEGRLPGRLVPEVFIASWTNFLDAGCGLAYGLWRDGELIGAIGGMLWPCPNDGVLQGAEMFWFVHPEKRGGGLKLLDAWEKGAEAAGAKRICMVHLEALAPEKLGRLFERRGYRKLETNYMKEV